MLERYKRYVIAAISVILGILIDRIFSLTREGEIVLEVILLILLAGALITYYILHQVEELKVVSFTVLLFILDEENRLLVVDNRYHRRLMIPCGNVPRTCTPSDAVSRFLAQQAHLSLKDLVTLQGEALDEAHLTPCNAQIEFVTKHEFSVQEHYAYIYFFRTKQPKDNRFLSLRELQAYGENGLFSDLLQRYERLLKEL